MAEWASSREHVQRLIITSGAGPWTLAELLAAGWSYERVRAAVTAGRLDRVRRGLYRVSNVDSPHEQVEAWRQTLGELPAAAVLSHTTAAEAHQLWIPRRWQDGDMHATLSGGVERRRPGLRIHGSRLPESAATRIDGVRVTTCARTALDLARGGSLADALMVMDSAARQILLAQGHDLRSLRDLRRRAPLRQIAESPLREAFLDVWTWPGTVVARAAIDLMDPASESPAESRSRAWIIAAKLPLPAVACAVSGASGAVYYSDFAWPGVNVLGEVDGFAKYGETAERMRARLRAERVRQDDLQDAGWRVLRWSTADTEEQVVSRIRRALSE